MGRRCRGYMEQVEHSAVSKSRSYFFVSCSRSCHSRPRQVEPTVRRISLQTHTSIAANVYTIRLQALSPRAASSDYTRRCWQATLHATIFCTETHPRRQAHSQQPGIVRAKLHRSQLWPICEEWLAYIGTAREVDETAIRTK